MTNKIEDVTTIQDEYRRGVPVVCHKGTIDEVDELIKVPEELFDSDGRRYGIVGWHPHVVAGGVLKIDISVIAYYPESPESESF